MCVLGMNSTYAIVHGICNYVFHAVLNVLCLHFFCKWQLGFLKLTKAVRVLGLDRTGHMSFLTGQDRTPKFAGWVLPDQTESRLIFLSILPNK